MCVYVVVLCCTYEHVYIGEIEYFVTHSKGKFIPPHLLKACMLFVGGARDVPCNEKVLVFPSSSSSSSASLAVDSVRRRQFVPDPSWLIYECPLAPCSFHAGGLQSCLRPNLSVKCAYPDCNYRLHFECSRLVGGHEDGTMCVLHCSRSYVAPLRMLIFNTYQHVSSHVLFLLSQVLLC